MITFSAAAKLDFVESHSEFNFQTDSHHGTTKKIKETCLQRQQIAQPLITTLTVSDQPFYLTEEVQTGTIESRHFVVCHNQQTVRHVKMYTFYCSGLFIVRFNRFAFWIVVFSLYGPFTVKKKKMQTKKKEE